MLAAVWRGFEAQAPRTFLEMDELVALVDVADARRVQPLPVAAIHGTGRTDGREGRSDAR
jgi:hypothetical protein